MHGKEIEGRESTCKINAWILRFKSRVNVLKVHSSRVKVRAFLDLVYIRGEVM